MRPYNTKQAVNVNICLENHFLSASARGENLRTSDSAGDNYISIHAPRAGSDEFPVVLVGNRVISIHAPRAGSDP